MVDPDDPWNGNALEPEETPEPYEAAVFDDPPVIVESGGHVENEAASTELVGWMVDGEWSEESSAASHELVVIEESGEELPLEGAPQHQLSMTRLVDVTSPQSEAEASAVSGKRSQSEHAAVAESS